MLTFHQSVPFCPKIVLAGQLAIRTEKMTLAIGESKSIKANYAFFTIVNQNATAAILGTLIGSAVEIIHKSSAAKISVEKGDSWGYLKITNNDDTELTFNVHLFT